MLSDCLTAVQQKALITAWQAANATSPKLGLFTNNQSPTPDDVLADFDEVSAGWYSKFSATFDSVRKNSDGSMSISLVSHQFNYGSATDDPISVTGYFVDNGATPPVLLFARKFATPITMAGTGDAVRIEEAGFTVPAIVQE